MPANSSPPPVPPPATSRWTAARLFAALWLAIVAWRWEVLDSPPYWDSAMGLFAEANFLVETGFDYRRLFGEAERFGQGGPAVYLLSVLPTLVAVVLAVSPSVRAALITLHLLNFAWAAGLATLMALLLRPRLGWPGAILVAAAFLTGPLVAVQVDMLGMDLPMATVVLVAMGLAQRGRFVSAALTGGLAFFVKQTGGAFLVALELYLLGLLATRWEPSDRPLRRRWVLGWIACHAILQSQLFLADWLGRLPQSSADRMERSFAFGLRTLALARNWCPELVLLLVGCLLASGAVAGLGWWRVRSTVDGGGWRRWRTALGELLLASPTTMLAWLIVLATLSTLAQLYTIPRYLLLPSACLWLIAAGLWGALAPRGARGRALGATALAAWLAFNALNHDGRLLPSLAQHDRTGAVWERSREYLADHRANQRTVAYLIAHHAGDRIVAPSPLAYFLAWPRLGYVAEPLTGYSLQAFHAPTFPRIEQILADRPSRPVFVWAANSFVGTAQCRLPQFEPGDELLHQDGLEPPVLVFRKPPLEATAEGDRESAYRRLLFPDSLAGDSIAQLLAQGRLVEAEVRLRRTLKDEPDSLALRHDLAVVLARAGQNDEAIGLLEAVVAGDPQRGESWALLGSTLANAGRLEPATEALAQAIRLLPTAAAPQKHLGWVELQTGQAAGAADHLARAAELDPQDVEAAYLHGLALRSVGDHAAGVAEFERALRLAPGHPEAHYQLGLWHDERGAAELAAAEYRAALAARPGWGEPANNLAWILATAADPALFQPSEAVQLAELARQTLGDQPGVLDTLAAALAAAGRFEEAARLARQAIALANQAGIPPAELEARLRLYEGGQAFRTPSRGP